ncbi:Hypothetical predicted protein [Mytilus galloprovincialis]|uniref:Fibrinogen C-terminal domain-containing protein n=1 Tax=Mytilus galloprovincialis TaxID=29158 RepID=A0A8B6BS88_MYTGA|nr:Hypothetical predicted protein [Mytilus galloprovincialis]
MQHNQEEIIMLTILIYGFTLCVLVLSDTPNSSDDVEVQLLDNQNAPLVATLDMSKANKRVKQFVSDTIEAKMKNIEDTVKSKQFVSDALEEKIKTIENTVKSKQFVSDALEAKMKTIEDTVKSNQFLSNAVEAKMKDLEVNLQSQMAYFERNLTDQLTEYINEIVGKIDGENEKCIRRPLDCKDVKTKKGNGIYKIYPNHAELGFDVYCDYEIDNGGWTVFQRRINGKTDFYRGWEAYENGFGDLEAEFWLGRYVLKLIILVMSNHCLPTHVRVSDLMSVCRRQSYP